ncbi:MAG: ATP-binding protein [Vicinamibacterales bacterium]
MRRILRLIGSFVVPEGALDLEDRFYQGLCVVGAFTALAVVIPANLLQDLPVLVNVAAGLFGTLCLVLHVLARRGWYYPNLVFWALLVTLNVSWFPNAASTGSLPFYFFTALMFPLIFFRGAWRMAAVVLVTANCTVLFYAERWAPGWVTPFRSDEQRLFDLSSGFIMSALACSIMLGVVLAGYNRERRRLRVTVTALDESRALLSALVESTDDMVWLAEPDTFAIALYNRAFAAYVRERLGREARVGMRHEDVLTPERTRVWHQRYRRALDEGPFTIEDRPNGRALLLSISPVRHGGQVVGVAVFGKDITDRKAAEEERERITVQLQQSQKLESLGKLAGGVAHDFNNMLAGILAHAELLLEEPDDPDRDTYARAIVQAATRSAELTRKLLAFGRRGKNIVEAVRLDDLARDTITMLQPTLSGDVTVRLAVPPDLSTVDGDPSQLHQVLVNLCVNAGEAMPRGGTLTVRLGNATLASREAAAFGLHAGEYVRLEVSDTGVGMTADVQARIFEPFFTTKDRGDVQGTGLGLSTVYGVVDSHQGVVMVDSAPEQGTTFRILLPRGRLGVTPRPEASEMSTGSGLVLVIEDEDLLRNVAQRALRTLGYEVLMAAEGRQGVEAFRARHGDLAAVLLDLKMPGMSGVEVFDQLVTIDAAVPILICSGYGDNEEAQGLITRGARGLLPKPYRLAELGDALSRVAG